MKIKKVEVCGFKSFVDRSVVLIDHEVTAVVGPNGCGKSNIVDAIRWAMGEQSARHLRGKNMEDVIFAGSETRGPHSFAEVTLTFENNDGLAPAEYRDYAEIAVTRRLDRSGTSEYLINKTPVRLMDITQLFLGTGVGTKAYSIIEQGKIGFIVSAKPSDRRHLIEEAAGITKFKAKKRSAERKMEQTRQNLLRIGDIVSEIERSLNALKRQAQKAERYKRYRTEARDLELVVASHRFMELTVTGRVLRNGQDQIGAEVDGTRAALMMREAELNADRQVVHDAEQAVETCQRQAYELDNTVRMLEGRIEAHVSRLEGLRESERMAERELGALAAQRAVLAQEQESLENALVDLEEIEGREAKTLELEGNELKRRRAASEESERAASAARSRVAEAQARIARGEAVLASFERRREEGRARLERLHLAKETHEAKAVEVKQEAEELKARLHGLTSGKETSAEAKEALETDLRALREQIQESDKVLERCRHELAQKRSRLRSLEEIQERFEGVGDGVRALMTRYTKTAKDRRAKGILGLVADHVECPEHLTLALAGALGERLQHVVVENEESKDQALAFLREKKRGRATLIPRQPKLVGQLRPALPSDEGVVCWLAEMIECGKKDRDLVEHLLGRVLVVENQAIAQVLHQSGLNAAIVTLDGELLEADGTCTAGRGEGVGAHMIAVKREIRQLDTVVTELESEHETTVAHHQTLRTSIAEGQASLDAARTAAHDAEIAIVKVEKDVRRAEEEAQRCLRRVEEVMADANELSLQLDAGEEESRAQETEVGHAKEAVDAARETLSSTEEVFEGHRASVEEQAQVVTSVKVRAAQARQRAEGDRSALERLERSAREFGEREVRIRGDVERGAVQQGQTAAQLYAAHGDLDVRAKEAAIAHEELGARRSEYEHIRQDLGEREQDLVAIREKIETKDKALSKLTLEERGLAKDLEHLLDSVGERHNVDLSKIIGDYHLRELPDAQMKSRIEELLRLISRMGEINLTAIEEYEEKSARYEYLRDQQIDLETALTQLDTAIKQMNRESRKLFRATFEAVNGLFKQVFPRLFGGGKAELRLTDPTDMLETGVEIIAQPPGKRLGSIELMSGGEKALTAVSLIFSIFQHRPSPFCILDEVDAPLDEANIARFSEAIRAMTAHSQFIVITHSKTTMQMADVLYGVTMETPGISKLVSVELRKKQSRVLDEDMRVA